MKYINQLIKEGYEKLGQEDVSTACNIWLDAWDDLKKLIKDKEIVNIEELDDEFEGFETLTNWVQDLEMELENAGIENKEYFSKRAIYCREFYELLGGTEEFIIMSMKLAEAESNFETNHIEESEELFKNCTNNYKSSVWPFLKWGDVYWLSSIVNSKSELLNLDKALEIYKMGLGIDKHEEYIVLDRISDVEKLLNK